jgi:hypothetical protein
MVSPQCLVENDVGIKKVVQQVFDFHILRGGAFCLSQPESICQAVWALP